MHHSSQSSPSRRHYLLNRMLISPSQANKALFAVSLLLAGDIHLNPGPRNNSVYPCGVFEDAVTWNCRGIACDNCSVWFHASCMELCTKDLSILEKPSVSWLCHKCDSVNCDSFTFRSFSLNCSNYYTPIVDPNVTIESLSSVFSPLKTSSPNNQPKVDRAE